MIPLGMVATLEEDMFDEWLDPGLRITWDNNNWNGTWTKRLNPWNAPGSAPVRGNGCGVNGGNPDGCTGGGEALGQCCGKPFTGDCGGYSGGKPALEHYRDGLFGEPHLTKWIRGQPAEVYWASNGFHRGGYAYRLCRVYNEEYWKVTEECFQKGHLKFSGKTSWLYWKPWVSQPKHFEWGWIPMELKTTTDKLNNLVLFDKGTYDKLYKEVPTYKLITPSIVSERLKVRGSLARRALIELMEKGLIKQVVAHRSPMIYTRMIGDKEGDDAEAEGGVVVEKKGKGKKDKNDAKAQAKAEAAAEAV